MSEQSVSTTCTWIFFIPGSSEKNGAFSPEKPSLAETLHIFSVDPGFRVGFMMGYPITISVAHRYTPGS